MSVTADLMDVMALGTVHDYGDQALLLEFESTAEVLAWADALHEADLLGVLDIVPASRTVLVKLAGPRYQAPTRQRLGKLRVTAEAVSEVTAPTDGRADMEIDIQIDVVYDGADLDEVARLTGRIRWIRTRFRLPHRRRRAARGAAAVRTANQGARRVGGAGRGVQRRLPARVSRGLAAHRAHLQRHSGAVGRRSRPTRPAETGHVGSVPGRALMTGAECAAQPRAALEVLRTGPLALIEDLGRAGLAHIGVTRSGAADRRSHTLANRLVANPGDRATIEVTFGGFSARVRGGDVAIAVTGADTDPSVNGKPFGTNSIQYAHDGQVISLGAPHSGLRTYLAVRGGIDVSPVLGSRSYDVMSAIGPLPLQPGDVLPIGEHSDEFPELDQAPVAAIEDDVLELMVVPGPRDDWFIDPDVLIRTNWQVTSRSDRVGMRLIGMPLEYRWPDRQLPSEGATRGAIQVPPNGFPVILGPDHPVTGGYPVIGVVTDEDIDKVAQIRPGQTVRLHWSHPRRPFQNRSTTRVNL
jgi:biotin-dependent carboxylase-like uncharacterized protein